MFDAVWSGDIETLTEEMNELLRKTISYHDYKEDFYHAFLAGIFTGAGYSVDSNRERGEGRSDVVVRNSSKGRVALFEAKYAKTLDGLEASCEAALQQIEDRRKTLRMTMMTSCAMALRFIKSGVWSRKITRIAADIQRIH